MEKPTQAPATKAQECAAFLLLTGIVAPLLMALIIASYGFGVWIFQMFTGPPTGH